MKIKVIKARKELGISGQIKSIGKSIGSQFNMIGPMLERSLYGKDIPESVLKESKKTEASERELELYKRPGFYTDRIIKIVDAVPRRPRSEIIYVSFTETGYEIRSGRNFNHKPLIDYGNLRYACVDLEHLITDKERNEVLSDLVKQNNGKLI